jgi:hypothetical protein
MQDGLCLVKQDAQGCCGLISHLKHLLSELVHSAFQFYILFLLMTNLYGSVMCM